MPFARLIQPGRKAVDGLRDGAEQARALNESLLEWIAETTVVSTGGRQVTVDEKTLEKLRALGYVE